MVLNIGRLRSGPRRRGARRDCSRGRGGQWRDRESDPRERGLDKEQKVTGCLLAEQAGAQFVKTSTGFAPSGAVPEDLKLMRATVSPHVQVKAAGGVRTLDALLAVMNAGVTRIGATATRTGSSTGSNPARRRWSNRRPRLLVMSCWQSGQRCRVLDGRPSLGEPKPPVAERLNPATDLFRTNEANLDTGRSSRARLFPGSVLVTEIRYGILLPDPGEKALALFAG